MSFPMRELCNDVQTLAADAGVLMDSTASAACKRYEEAREGCVVAPNRDKDIARALPKRIEEVVRVADKAVYHKLYQTIIISIGIGSLLGCFLVHTYRFLPD